MSAFAREPSEVPTLNMVPLTFWPLLAALWQPLQLRPLGTLTLLKISWPRAICARFGCWLPIHAS